MGILEWGDKLGNTAMNARVITADTKLEPYWWEAAPRSGIAPDEVPATPAKADVVIVGSGYSGLSAALTLARAGRSVVVLEAGAPGEGASSRNGGLCGGAFKVPLSKMIARMGRAPAVAIWRDGERALDYTAELIDREGIACHFARMGRFSGAHSPHAYEAMARETEVLRREIGLEADMVPRAEQHAEIGSDAYFGGRILHRDGGLHPALYHQGLLDRALAAGVAVLAHTPATGITRTNGGFAVATPRGTIAARDVIVATNGYTGSVTPALRRRLVPVGSFMIATEPLAPAIMARLMPKGRILTDSKRMLYYFRPSPDGARILFGGRASFRQDNDLRVTGAMLHRFMVGVYPELVDLRVTHSWTGNVAFTFDRLPHAGVRDGVHYALGYCGSGVVKGTWLGHQAALHVLDPAKVETPLFDRRFPPLPLYWGRPWFLPFVGAWYHLRDRLGR